VRWRARRPQLKRDPLGGEDDSQVSIEDQAVVDAIGIARDTGCVILTISDHLPWDEANEHLLTLQAKLNRYLAFIEGGELLEKYPAAKGKPVQIELVCKYPPSNDGRWFLGQAEATVRTAGSSLSWRVLAA